VLVRYKHEVHGRLDFDGSGLEPAIATFLPGMTTNMMMGSKSVTGTGQAAE
jgi:hypothetical protein